MAGCGAKIRPFPNETELECEHDPEHGPNHEAVLRDYAHPGSETEVTWHEDDRRTFYGEWAPCELNVGCTLPAGHRGDHA